MCIFLMPDDNFWVNSSGKMMSQRRNCGENWISGMSRQNGFYFVFKGRAHRSLVYDVVMFKKHHVSKEQRLYSTEMNRSGLIWKKKIGQHTCIFVARDCCFIWKNKMMWQKTGKGIGEVSFSVKKESRAVIWVWFPGTIELRNVWTKGLSQEHFVTFKHIC